MTKETTSTKEILVFVYGTLKTGGRFHYRLTGTQAYCGNGTLIGDARILNKEYVMRDLTSFPALQRVEPGSGTYIKGELYLIDAKTLAVLDQVEDYPHLYNRELIDVWVDKQALKAWVYYMKCGDGNTAGTAGRNTRIMTQAPVVQSGEWDAIQNVPYKCDTGATTGPTVVCGDSIEDTRANDCAETEGRDESVPWIGDGENGANFEVDEGVYVNNEYGDYWGPFDNIKDAVGAIADGSVDTSGSNVLSVGFRMIRADIDGDALADIDQSTEEVYARVNR